MARRDIYVTEFDLKRLGSLLQTAQANARHELGTLKELNNELNRARIVRPEEVPGDIVTMNSEVRLRDVKSGEVTICRLVFPGDANIDEHRISVLAPMGTALLGYRTGDTVEWMAPGGKEKLKIEAVTFQPEASGRFDL